MRQRLLPVNGDERDPNLGGNGHHDGARKFDFRGIEIGNVTATKVDLDPTGQRFNIVIEANICPERLRKRLVTECAPPDRLRRSRLSASRSLRSQAARNARAFASRDTHGRQSGGDQRVRALGFAAERRARPFRRRKPGALAAVSRDIAAAIQPAPLQ